MLNQYTSGNYEEVIRKAKLKVDFSSFELAGQYKKLRIGELRELYDEKSLYWKIKAYLKEFLVWIKKK